MSKKILIIDHCIMCPYCVPEHDGGPTCSFTKYGALEYMVNPDCPLEDAPEWVYTPELPEQDCMVWVYARFNNGKDNQISEAIFRDGNFMVSRWDNWTNIVIAWMPRFIPEEPAGLK